MSDSEPAVKRTKQNNEVSAGATAERLDRATNADLLKEANEALQESNRIHVKPIIDETKLGIELFVGDQKDQFHGLIKTRYSDFIVHEVDPDGNIAYLTQLEPPEEDEPVNPLSLSDFVDNKALECIGEVNDGYLNQYKIDVTDMDKDSRTSLHQAIRAAFDRVESSTLTETEIAKANDKNEKNNKTNDHKTESQEIRPDSKNSDSNVPLRNDEQQESIAVTQDKLEKKYIIITRRNKISRPKNVWPRDRPDHTHFILYKENKDTMEAIHNLAAAINARPLNFSSAGIKDKRAVTTQWLSAWRLEPRRLVSATRRFNKRPFLKVGNFCFKKEPIRLGQLKANRFDIVIRNLVYGIGVIEKAMESIKDKGFINYFGLQRFGSRSVQTHEIGLAILQTNWEKAIDLILSTKTDDNMQPLPPQDKNAENVETNDDHPDNQGAQKRQHRPGGDKRWTNGAEQHNSFIDLWKSKLDAEIVFKKYPHFRYSNEGLIMKSLSKSDDTSKNFFNAIISLPRSNRSLYVHSYQSFLWNKLTTYRLKKYGFNVIPGDLILSSDSKVSDNSLDLLLSTDELDHVDSNVSTESKTSTKNGEGDDHRKPPIEELNSKILTATEENLHKYSIFDVVLPIIGSRVRMPVNDVGEHLKKLLENDELNLDSFQARERFFISYGSYRKIMVKPSSVNWRIKQYSHPQQNLVETDLDRLNREIALKNKETEQKPPALSPKSDSSDEALIVEFELPSSTYATMCLREIMKKPSTEFNSKF